MHSGFLWTWPGFGQLSNLSIFTTHLFLATGSSGFLPVAPDSETDKTLMGFPVTIRTIDPLLGVGYKDHIPFCSLKFGLSLHGFVLTVITTGSSNSQFRIKQFCSKCPSRPFNWRRAGNLNREGGEGRKCHVLKN